jgi:hypothetical protein
MPVGKDNKLLVFGISFLFIILLRNIDFRMKKELWFLGFLNQKGRALFADYQSEEKALSVEDALQAIELLSEEKTAIYGGEILTEADGELVYAHDIWGKEYHYLNWYCDKSDDEERADYLQRSYDKAKEGIVEAKKAADRLGKKCYIVLVTEYIHLT